MIKRMIALGLCLCMCLSLFHNTHAEQSYEKSGEYYGPVDGEEIIEKREECGKHYKLPDGTYQYIGYTNRIHYLDENSLYQDIDNHIIEEKYISENTEYSFRNKASDIIVRFAQQVEEGEYPIRIEYKGCSVSYSFPDIELEYVSDYNYPLVMESLINNETGFAYHTNRGYDLAYTVTSKGLKEFIIVNEPQEELILDYIIETEDLVFELKEGRATFHNEEKELFSVAEMYAFDSAEDLTGDLHLEYNQIDETHVKLHLNCDSGWFHSEDRIYPIVIDPTTIVTGTDITQDAQICSSKPNTKYGDIALLRTGNNSTFGVCRSVMKFSLPALHPMQVVTAMIRVRKYNGSTPDIYAYNLTSSWSENTVTWNTSPSYDSSLVSMKGVAVTINDTNDWYSMHVYNMILDWYINPGTYFGVMIKDTVENNSSKLTKYYSSETSNIDNCPQIMIAYVNIQAVLIGVPQTETEFLYEGIPKNRAECMHNVGTTLQGMGYGSVKHTVPITKQQIDNYLNIGYYQIFATRSHGGYDINSGVLIDTYLGLGDNGSYTSVDLSYHDLSHMQLMVFVGCNTGYHPLSDPTSSNTLVDVAVEQGATCAVGFDPVIDYEASNSWIEAFFDGLSEGHNVLYTCSFLATTYLEQETGDDDFGVDEYVIKGNQYFTLQDQ